MNNLDTNTDTFAADHPVAAEMGKNFAGAIATTAGLVVGRFLVEKAKDKIEQRRARKLDETLTETTN